MFIFSEWLIIIFDELYPIGLIIYLYLVTRYLLIEIKLHSARCEIYDLKENQAIKIVFYYKKAYPEKSYRLAKINKSTLTVNSFILRKHFTCDAVIAFIEQQSNKRIDPIAFRMRYGEEIAAISAQTKEDPKILIQMSEETFASVGDSPHDIKTDYVI